MKKIVFLTGTRADYGKLKSLISVTQNSDFFETHVFVTGMHLNKLYGYTVNEIEKNNIRNLYKFENHDSVKYMDRTLAKTINGFSKYIENLKPDLIIIHGDRVEALAGALVGSINNILVAHIEGGEVSGTIDEMIRHSVSKMSHIHLVSNKLAKRRLIQMGEYDENIFIIGSPDLDLMKSEDLPSLRFVKKYYNIEFEEYSIAMFHPITTEYQDIKSIIKNFVDAIIASNLNYILIFPNNDLGTEEILEEFKRLNDNSKFRIFPSLRFEYFLKLLNKSEFIIGNSSAGIREAPYYNIPTIDIGTRQNNRDKAKSIINCDYSKKSILKAIKEVSEKGFTNQINKSNFGDGNSDKLFYEILNKKTFWEISPQKFFKEL